MKQHPSSVRFFGLNLRQLQHNWSIAISQMTSWAVFRWLQPTYATRLRMANGETIDYVEKTGQSTATNNQAKIVKFAGFVLPENLVLWHSLGLPKLSADAIRSAVELEVRSLSPFLPEDVVWSFTQPIAEQQGSRTNIVIASRKIISKYIASLPMPPPDPKGFEIWVSIPQRPGFLVLDGFGEQNRQRLTRRWWFVNLSLVFLLAVVGLAAAVSPTAQLRLRATQAAHDYEKLRLLAAPAMQQRELLTQLNQQVKALELELAQTLRPELILMRITKLLPDDSYVTSLQVQGTKILLTGQTANTSALMQQLGSQAGVKDVRAPTAAVKLRGTERETFYIEFTLDPASLIAQP